ncbi:ribbon-helix-helix domain-containing protein [Tropicimonas sp. TH_r6]|uniref:ribbon-helix-helix domain-containing protein n=1 Tax=Tropicimonas sp. TH_r6 TaxID=3082085 RepID=UPI002955B456|nr:ribbon-helix-helix domain-containing protein [Tropicimonas sp. TH_r6]MDV7142256.1 ribbon-helix-helix domain-containing protein [Tropicimonas sp. TH_r6]
MCRLFIEADTTLWEYETREIRVDGAEAALRIESFYWGILDRIAHRDGMNTEELLHKLYSEAIEADHTVGTFSSFLRVCCGRYLDLLGRGEIPDDDTPIRDLDADAILKREKRPTLRLVD